MKVHIDDCLCMKLNKLEARLLMKRYCKRQKERKYLKSLGILIKNLSMQYYLRKTLYVTGAPGEMCLSII